MRDDFDDEAADSAKTRVTHPRKRRISGELGLAFGQGGCLVVIYTSEPTQLGSGGSFEPRPPRVGSVQTGTVPTLMVTTPSVAGEYRLFVYVIDGHGHAGTANVPFRVN